MKLTEQQLRKIIRKQIKEFTKANQIDIQTKLFNVKFTLTSYEKGKRTLFIFYPEKKAYGMDVDKMANQLQKLITKKIGKATRETAQPDPAIRFSVDATDITEKDLKNL